MNQSIASINPRAQYINKLRVQVLSVAGRFEDNPGYKLSRSERALVSTIIPQFGLQVNFDQRRAVFQALTILELLTQPLTLQMIEQGQDFEDVWRTAIREFSYTYGDWLVDLLYSPEGEAPPGQQPSTPSPIKSLIGTPPPRLIPKPISPSNYPTTKS